MLVAASVVFLYYSIWTLAMVSFFFSFCFLTSPIPHERKNEIGFVLLTAARPRPALQPFVDSDHPLHAFFPPRVWAIRIPVILILLGSAVVGSFLSVVMIRSNRKKAAKAKAAAAKKKA